MELRPYQKQCIEVIEKSEIGKYIISMPTGSGKTICFATLCKNVKGRAIIIVDQKELRQQTIDKLIMVGVSVDEIGSVQGNLDDVSARIVICTRQSLTHSKSDRVERILAHGNFELIIIDESHKAIDQQIKITDKLNDTKILGFTATPFVKTMTELYSEILFEIDLETLMSDGYLCTPRAFRKVTNTSLLNVANIGGEFNQGQLASTINNTDRNEAILEAYEEKCSEIKSCVIFCASIEHSIAVRDLFIANGYDCRSVDSTNSAEERDSVLSDFQEGKFPIITNVGILTTGWDMESLGAIILAVPTRSKVKYFQMLGRCLRISPGKVEAIVIDIVDLAREFSLKNMESIFDIKDNENFDDVKIRKKKEKDDELQEEIQKQIEEEEHILEQERLELEEIDLFNSNINNIYTASNLDWYDTKINNKVVYILSAKSDIDYYIYMNEFGNYVGLEYRKLLNYKYELSEIIETKNLIDVLGEVEELAKKDGSSFIKKYVTWKCEPASQKQIDVCKNAKIKTKWDCTRYFSKRNAYFAIK